MRFNVEDIIHVFQVGNDLYISEESADYDGYIFSIQRAAPCKFVPFLKGNAINSLSVDEVAGILSWMTGDVYFPLSKDKDGNAWFESAEFNDNIGHSKRDIANLIHKAGLPDLIIKVSKKGVIYSTSFDDEEVSEILLDTGDITQSELDYEWRMVQAEERYEAGRYDE